MRTKICSRCGIEAPLTEFNKKRSDCKTCDNGRRSEYHAKNPLNDYGRRLKSKYGITLEDYTVMLVNQNYRCAICKKDNVKLHVDHCHQSMNVRGLLCHKCNVGIGFLKDDIDLLCMAVIYLNQSNKGAA